MQVPKGNKALYSSYFIGNCLPDAMEIYVVHAKNRKENRRIVTMIEDWDPGITSSVISNKLDIHTQFCKNN